MPSHVLITGTGRTGTTVLVQILTDLGLDTGFAPDAPIDPHAHAGLERCFIDPDAPRVVKDTLYVGALRDQLSRGQVEIEHVIVPMRELDVAAASRVRVSNFGKTRRPGGLTGTTDPTRQSRTLMWTFYELMGALAEFEIPLTLLWFPRWVTDPEYTHRQLGFLTPHLGAHAWRRALETRVDRSLINQTPLSVRERVRARLLGRHNSKRELKRLKPELAKALAARRASEEHTAEEARQNP
jgi:hypothetical protein